MRACEACGDPFTPDKQHATQQRFCSRRCKTRIQSRKYRKYLGQRTLKCHGCGNEFPVSARARGDTKWCSKSCRQRNWMRVQRDVPMRQCPVCLIQFKLNRPGSPQAYCSPSCSNKGRYEVLRAKKAAMGVKVTGRVCPDCCKPVIIVGQCYDCACPGMRSLAPAVWLWEKARKFGQMVA